MFGFASIFSQDEGATWATEKLQKSEADWQIMATEQI